MTIIVVRAFAAFVSGEAEITGFLLK